ncbi:MAG: HipA family kinase, partial [Acidobacteriota bacterium]
IVEADDDGLYVLKFRGAGQGPRALIAELVAGEVARALRLPVPELVFADLALELARTEPDPEIHGLMHDSAGLNLALDYLPGSVTFDPVIHKMDQDLAARLVWFDGLVTNVDRTARNTNLLIWHRTPWLIDHGASLYFHHAPGWDGEPARARDPFAMLDRHVLRARAGSLAAADAASAPLLSVAVLDGIVALIPDAWLASADATATPAALRAAYVRYLTARLEAPRPFLTNGER